jgi:hypothetical protein
MILPTHNVAIQQAWIVNNLEETAKKWSAMLSVGPFYIAEYSPQVFGEIEYRGKPGKLHMNTAITYAGDIQIELVEPVGIYPCAYFDTIEPGSSGFHHLCFWTEDIEADIAHYIQQGCTVANLGQIAGNGPRFAYLDASKTLGYMIELLERSAGTEATFNGWKENAKNWQPGDPDIIKL